VYSSHWDQPLIHWIHRQSQPFQRVRSEYRLTPSFAEHDYRLLSLVFDSNPNSPDWPLNFFPAGEGERTSAVRPNTQPLEHVTGDP